MKFKNRDLQPKEKETINIGIIDLLKRIGQIRMKL